ncbi:MAG TPA: DNA polymerase III subunit delta' [Casimicrobiaceae bacterium]
MSDTAEPRPVAWQGLLPWQHDAAAAALAARSRWPHALLITGRLGIGKRSLALYFAQALLCEAPRADGSPCGRCASCGYLVSGAHPDSRLIEPVEYDEAGDPKPVDAIVVERIRELIEFTQLTAHRQRAKVALIAPADALNAAAGNALLKTLEEPPAGTYLLLVSDRFGRLPATIVSRCRRLPAPEPDARSAIAWLAAQRVERPELLLAQAGGAPLLALTLADAVTQREREALLDALARPDRLSPVAFGARLDAYPRDERKARLADAVYWLLAWTADLAAVASGGAPRFSLDRGEALANLGPRVARVALFRYYRALLRQRALLGHPLAPRPVAEALLFEYRGLFAGEGRRATT